MITSVEFIWLLLSTAGGSDRRRCGARPLTSLGIIFWDHHWKPLETIGNDTRRSSAKIGQIQKETDLLRKIYNFDNVDQDDIVVIAYRWGTDITMLEIDNKLPHLKGGSVFNNMCMKLLMTGSFQRPQVPIDFWLCTRMMAPCVGMIRCFLFQGVG